MRTQSIQTEVLLKVNECIIKSGLFFEKTEVKKVSISDIVEFIFDWIHEGSSYQRPVVIDKNSGKNYQIFAIGFDINFNILFYCREVK